MARNGGGMMMGQRGMPAEAGTGGAVATDEPGAVDNRLSLDPNDERWAETVGAWEDGKTYTLEKVVVQQISPGEFEVVSIGDTSDGAEEETENSEEAETAAEETGAPAPPAAGRKRNPAIIALIGAKK